MAYNPIDPRMRVNFSAGLNLSTTFQKIDFAGTSSSNVNTFGVEPVSGNPMVWWDPTNKLFRFYQNNDTNFQVNLQIKTTSTLITTRATLQYRFVVPNGGGVGVNTYFPFPDDGGYADFSEVTVLASGQNNSQNVINFFAGSAIRTNGCWLEMRLSNSLITLGVCTLNSAAITFLATGK